MRYVRWFVSRAFHVSSPLPNVPSLLSAAAPPSQILLLAFPGFSSRSSEERRSRHLYNYMYIAVQGEKGVTFGGGGRVTTILLWTRRR
jgi:hypothetical protein